MKRAAICLAMMTLGWLLVTAGPAGAADSSWTEQGRKLMEQGKSLGKGPATPGTENPGDEASPGSGKQEPSQGDTTAKEPPPAAGPEGTAGGKEKPAGQGESLMEQGKKLLESEKSGKQSGGKSSDLLEMGKQLLEKEKK